MAQGKRLSDTQIEEIRLAYAETGVVADAARAAGCSEASARKYCHAPNDGLAELRAEKKADVVAKIAEVRSAYLDHMLKESVIKEATAKDSAVIVGVLTDKHQLLSGAATARTETTAADPNRLTPEEKEQAARLRAKLLGEVPV